MINDTFENYFLFNKEMGYVNEQLIVKNTSEISQEENETRSLEGGTCQSISRDINNSIKVQFLTYTDRDRDIRRHYNNMLNDQLPYRDFVEFLEQRDRLENNAYIINTIPQLLSINRYITQFNIFVSDIGRTSTLGPLADVNLPQMTAAYNGFYDKNFQQILKQRGNPSLQGFGIYAKLYAKLYKAIRNANGVDYTDYSSLKGIISSFNIQIYYNGLKVENLNVNRSADLTKKLNKYYDISLINYALIRHYLVYSFALVIDSQLCNDIRTLFKLYVSKEKHTLGRGFRFLSYFNTIIRDNNMPIQLKYIVNLYTFFLGHSINYNEDNITSICELLSEMMIASTIFSDIAYLYICDCQLIIYKNKNYNYVTSTLGFDMLNTIINKCLYCNNSLELVKTATNTNPFTSSNLIINLNKIVASKYLPEITLDLKYTNQTGEIITTNHKLEDTNARRSLIPYKNEDDMFENKGGLDNTIMQVKSPLFLCKKSVDNCNYFTNSDSCKNENPEYNSVRYKNCREPIIDKFVDCLDIFKKKNNLNILNTDILNTDINTQKNIFKLAGIFSRLVYLPYDSITEYIYNYNQENRTNIKVRGFIPDPEWNSNSITNRLCDQEYRDIQYYEYAKYYLYYFIDIKDDYNTIYITHRGSLTYRDWNEADVDITSNRGQYCERVYQSVDAIYDILNNYLEVFGDKEVKIYVCGHSLGGYLSLMTSYMFAEKLHTYTYTRDRKVTRDRQVTRVREEIYLNTHQNYIIPICFNPFIQWRNPGLFETLKTPLSMELNNIFNSFERGYIFRVYDDQASWALANNALDYNLNMFTLFDNFSTKLVTSNPVRIVEKLVLDHDMVNFIGLENLVKMFQYITKLTIQQFKNAAILNKTITFTNSKGDMFNITFYDISRLRIRRTADTYREESMLVDAVPGAAVPDDGVPGAVRDDSVPDADADVAVPGAAVPGAGVPGAVPDDGVPDADADVAVRDAAVPDVAVPGGGLPGNVYAYDNLNRPIYKVSNRFNVYYLTSDNKKLSIHQLLKGVAQKKYKLLDKGDKINKNKSKKRKIYKNISKKRKIYKNKSKKRKIYKNKSKKKNI
jgi:hypothetical protein